MVGPLIYKRHWIMLKEVLYTECLNERLACHYIQGIPLPFIIAMSDLDYHTVVHLPVPLWGVTCDLDPVPRVPVSYHDY